MSWVLVHGTPLTPAVWDGVVPFLTSPALRPDISGPPRGDDPHEAHVGAVSEIIGALDEPVDLVGHSYGGQVALDAALRLPERVRSLTLLCSRDTPYPAFGPVAAALRRGDAPATEAVLGRWFTPEESAAGGPVLDYARRCVSGADPLAWAAALDAIATFDRASLMHGIAHPVTLIAAERDTVSTPEAMRDMSSRIPRSRFLTLAGAAHLSPFEHPDALADLLLAATGGG